MNGPGVNEATTPGSDRTGSGGQAFAGRFLDQRIALFEARLTSSRSLVGYGP